HFSTLSLHDALPISLAALLVVGTIRYDTASTNELASPEPIMVETESPKPADGHPRRWKLGDRWLVWFGLFAGTLLSIVNALKLRSEEHTSELQSRSE